MKKMLNTDALKLHCSLAYMEPKGGWLKFDWSTAEPEVCVKGATFKKRDRCNFVQKHGKEFIKMVLHQYPDMEILKMIEKASLEITNTKISSMEELKPFIITCKLGEESEYASHEILALHLKNEILEENGIAVMTRRRMEYVVARFTDDRKRYLRAMTPEKFIREGHTLDTRHYLLTQFYPPLKQLTEMHLPILDRKIGFLLEQRAIKLDMEAEGQSQELTFICRKKKRELLDILSPSLTNIQDPSTIEELSTIKELSNIQEVFPVQTDVSLDVQMLYQPRLSSISIPTSSILLPLPPEYCNQPVEPPKLKRPRINLADLGLRIGG